MHFSYKNSLLNNLKKYDSSFEYYANKISNDIVYDEQKRIVCYYREHLLWNEETEFLKRYYGANESEYRIPKIAEYYMNFSITLPNYSIISPCKVIKKYIKRKQKLFENKENSESLALEKGTYERILPDTELKSTIKSNRHPNLETINSNIIKYDIDNLKMKNSFLEDGFDPFEIKSKHQLKNLQINHKAIKLKLIKFNHNNKICTNIKPNILSFANKNKEKDKRITSLIKDLIKKVPAIPKSNKNILNSNILSNEKKCINLNSRKGKTPLNSTYIKSNENKGAILNSKTSVNKNYFKINFNVNINVTKEKNKASSRNVKSNICNNLTNLTNLSKGLSIAAIKDYLLSSKENSVNKKTKDNKAVNKISINLEPFKNSNLLSEVTTPKGGIIKRNNKQGFNLLSDYQNNTKKSLRSKINYTQNDSKSGNISKIKHSLSICDNKKPKPKILIPNIKNLSFKINNK